MICTYHALARRVFGILEKDFGLQYRENSPEHQLLTHKE